MEKLTAKLTKGLELSEKAANPEHRRSFMKATVSHGRALLSALDQNRDMQTADTHDVAWQWAAETSSLTVMRLLDVINQRTIGAGDLAQLPHDQWRDHATERLRELKQRAAEIEGYRRFAEELLRDPRTEGTVIAANGKGVVFSATGTLAADGYASLLFHEVRLLSYELPDDVLRPLAGLQGLKVELNRIAAVMHELKGAEPDREEKSEAAWREMIGVTEKIEHHAYRFARAAAEHWTDEGGTAEQWQYALELADAYISFTTQSFKFAEEKLRPSKGGGREAQAAGEASAAEATHPAAPAEAATSSAPPKGAQSSRRSRRPSRPSRPAVAATESAAPLPDVRAVALRRANDVLNKTLGLTSKKLADARGDPLILARQMVKDTQTIELMIQDGHDPLSIASVMRSSVESWFGNAAALLRMREQIGSLEPDAEVKSRIAALDERIAVLGQLNARLRSQESDALKQHEFPRARHVQRMLELGEIQRISAPVALPSDGDDGEHGTLFELQIQPRRLADGRRADALFVHVHTKQPVSAEECLSMQASAFAAIHIKTARQKNLGRRWEDMQRALGEIDSVVHRGKVDEPLWSELKVRAGAALAPAVVD